MKAHTQENPDAARRPLKGAEVRAPIRPAQIGLCGREASYSWTFQWSRSCISQTDTECWGESWETRRRFAGHTPKPPRSTSDPGSEVLRGGSSGAPVWLWRHERAVGDAIPPIPPKTAKDLAELNSAPQSPALRPEFGGAFPRLKTRPWRKSATRRVWVEGTRSRGLAGDRKSTERHHEHSAF